MTKTQKIKESLVEQLKKKNANVYHFEKLVDDYCSFCETMENLKEDIKTRGTLLKTNIKGESRYTTNPSILDMAKVSAQMLKILDKLGINIKETITEDEQDEL